MAHHGPHPPLALARDSADPVWGWFILNRPHGARFRWQREVAWTSHLQLLAQFIVELDDRSPGFAVRARAIAIEALAMEDPILIRTGIQALAVLGAPTDLAQVGLRQAHQDPLVARDARCCLFERKHHDFTVGARVRAQLEGAAPETATVDRGSEVTRPCS